MMSRKAAMFNPAKENPDTIPADNNSTADSKPYIKTAKAQ